MPENHPTDRPEGGFRPSRRAVLGAGLAVGTAVAVGAPAAHADTAPAHPRPDGLDFEHRPPFSFTYRGTPSTQLLPRLRRHSQRRRLDHGRTRQIVTWTAPDGLRVSCTAISYDEHGVVEWTVRFANTGRTSSGRLTDVLALDLDVTGLSTRDWTIHANHGSSAQRFDFQPLTFPLPTSGDRHLFRTVGGKSTSEYDVTTQVGWPLYNLDWRDGGLIVGLGWPGQWGVEVSRAAGGPAVVRGGMTNGDGFFTDPLPADPAIHDLGLTDLYLEPGEEIRTPLAITMPWRGGDWIDAQNRWRRWVLAHNTPCVDGAPPAPISAASSAEPIASVEATADTYIGVISAYDRHGLTPRHGGHLDWLWIDTGWFPIPDSVDPQDPLAWSYTGTWRADPPRFPHGMAEVTRRAREFGAKTIVWHEPERTRPGTWLYEKHPEWLLADGDPEWRYLDWGNAEAYAWAVRTFDGLIRSGGVNLFRIDFNYNGPLVNWNASDPAGRAGATQAHWCEGFLRFLDEIRRRNPHVIVESCASGGRRLDLETMRRCISMTKTDLFRDSITAQCTQYGISPWLVCHGGSADAYSTYGIRSAMGWHLEAHLQNVIPGDPNPPTEANWRTLAAGFDEWATIADCYFGDFYPLSPHDVGTAAWMSYQYDRPEQRRGVVQVFAREDTPAGSFTAVLRGLEPARTYRVRDLDRPHESTVRTGRSLMTTGVTVTPSERPHAVTITYRADRGSET